MQQEDEPVVPSYNFEKMIAKALQNDEGAKMVGTKVAVKKDDKEEEKELT